MGYHDCIRIERERAGFEVRLADPEIIKENKSRSNSSGNTSGDAWKDPNVGFKFASKAEVLKFLDKAMDIALPEDTYSTAFDKIAKEAQNNG